MRSASAALEYRAQASPFVGGELVRGRFLALWAAPVLATAAALLVHLALRFETVRLGYAVFAERREQRKLIEMHRLLAIESATLRQSSRVEAIARTVLGMDVPDRSRIVPVGASMRTNDPAGRTR